MTLKIGKNIARPALASAAALALVAGLAAQPAAADPWHHHGWHGGGGNDLAAGVLLGVGTAVVVNELSRPHYAPPPPPPRRVYVESEPTVVYREAPRYYYSDGSPLDRAFVTQDRELRISIQYHLMQDGYYNGAIDGVWGPGTRGALLDYAHSHGRMAELATIDGTNHVFSDILR